MFAEDIQFYSGSLAKASIISSTVPATFPLTSDNVDAMQDGVKLAPGSTVYVPTTQQVFMLGTNDDWEEQ